MYILFVFKRMQIGTHRIRYETNAALFSASVDDSMLIELLDEVVVAKNASQFDGSFGLSMFT